MRLALGAGSPVSEIRVRGRLIGKPLGDRMQFSIDQGYQYNKNDAYQFGAQSVDFDISITRNITSSTQFFALGWGGLLVLGAVDSIPPPGSVVPEEPGEDAGQGVATGPRNYDYGPGTNFGGIAELRHGRTNLRFWYEAHQLHVLDGARANHLLQRARADLRFPVRGRLGIGVVAEFFDRHTYFQLEGVDDADFHFPQLRVAMTWGGK